MKNALLSEVRRRAGVRAQRGKAVYLDYAVKAVLILKEKGNRYLGYIVYRVNHLQVKACGLFKGRIKNEYQNINCRLTIIFIE